MTSERVVSPDAEKAKNILAKLWTQVLEETQSPPVDSDIRTIMTKAGVAIRYALPTQLLGKLVDHSLDCLCLQKGKDDDPKRWDPRGFCVKVIVPWVAENEGMLGTSPDPYVGKPLRRERLEASPKNVKNASLWELLYNILSKVEQENKPSYTRKQFLEVLRCIRIKFTELSFKYAVPTRVSIKQTLLLIEEFLSEPSGGDRGLSVAAALFETIRTFFGIYSEINRHVINTADAAKGRVADIECIDLEGALALAVEVKERNLTLMDVKSTVHKARRASLRELLFNAPGIKKTEESEIEDLINRTWASGTNLYCLKIDEIMKVVLMLTGEDGRIYFLKEIGNQLDTYNTQPANRKRWKDLLEAI